jgi:hypothetical protein
MGPCKPTLAFQYHVCASFLHPTYLLILIIWHGYEESSQIVSPHPPCLEKPRPVQLSNLYSMPCRSGKACSIPKWGRGRAEA